MCGCPHVRNPSDGSGFGRLSAHNKPNGMLQRLRAIAVWTLFVTFVAGGVVAPSLHRAQHAAERTAESLQPTEHAPTLNGEAPVTEADGVPTPPRPHYAPAEADAPDCTLCGTRLLVLDSAQTVARAALALTSSQGHAPPSLASSAVVDRPSIRGPPSLA